MTISAQLIASRLAVKFMSETFNLRDPRLREGEAGGGDADRWVQGRGGRVADRGIHEEDLLRHIHCTGNFCLVVATTIAFRLN